jgi:predicted SprT family Zn-dependent metalloprotease
MKFYVTDNADHPLEHEVVRVTKGYLDKMQWPFERLPVRIQFGIRTVPSQSLVTAELSNGRLRGKVSIFYNYLYLLQRESLFITEIVPHEVAHVLATAESLRNGTKIKEHGPEWQRWLMSLSINATPRASGPGDIFDDRAIRLFRGGIPVKCQCVGEDGFNVLPPSSEQKVHETTCGRCDTAYSRTGRDSMTPEVAAAYEYIANEQSCRNA